MKCSSQELHISFIISTSPCRTYIVTPAQSVLRTQSLPSPLTLCVWPAVPFTLIKTTKRTNSPLHPVPFAAHTPLPSALIAELSVLLIGVISSSKQFPFPPSFTAIYEKSAGETEAIAFDGRTFIEYHNAVTKR